MSPLEGIQVIDAGLLVQGPQAAAYLCDMGADVIKVELPGFGDQSRFVHLNYDDMRSAYFTACNRGKRSMTLDLRTTAGQDIIKRMLKSADVLISNFKPGTLDEWGLGYEALAILNPGLIWAAGSTFGPLGTDRDREGADLSAQCAGGLVSTTGRDGDPPSPVGITIADHIGSLNLVCGVLAALHARQTTGRGQKVETSLLGGQIWAQAAEYTHYFMTGKVPGRANFGHPLIRAPYRIFETASSWIGLVGVPLGGLDEFLIAIERADLLLDERIGGIHSSKTDLDWFTQELAVTFKTRTTEEWCEVLKRANVRYAPVRDYAMVVNDPNAWANGYMLEVNDEVPSPNKVVGTPLRLSDTPLRPHNAAPKLGEDTHAILKEIGISEQDFESLKTDGVI